MAPVGGLQGPWCLTSTALRTEYQYSSASEIVDARIHSKFSDVHFSSPDVACNIQLFYINLFYII